jgi:hypothetical protein
MSNPGPSGGENVSRVYAGVISPGQRIDDLFG